MNEIVTKLAAGPLKCILGAASCKGYPAVQGSCFHCHALDPVAKWVAEHDAETGRLGNELVAVLTDFAGDGGKAEGAVECLSRITAELKRFRSEFGAELAALDARADTP